MFFVISKDKDTRFPINHQLVGGWWLNTDRGWTGIWTNQGFVHFKGYCLDRPVDRTFAEQIFVKGPLTGRGSFTAVLAHNDGRVEIKHDQDRAYPLWWSQETQQLGNIGLPHAQNIWADAVATLTVDGQLIEERWSSFRQLAPCTPMTDVVEFLYNKLCRTFKYLYHNKPVRVFFSGGIDTLTCIAFLRHLDIQHQMIWAEHFEYDQFTCEFLPELKSHPGYWGYQQLHHWRERNYLVTGGMGDEIFMRGPTTVNMMLMHLGMTMDDLLSDNDYHSEYFRKPKNLQIYHQQSQDAELTALAKDRDKLVTHIINNVSNDHQHWHLGNTITFTPFKDTEMLSAVLSLSNDDLIKQMSNAELQRQLIERTDPTLLQYLSVHKNEGPAAIWKMYRDLN